MTFDQTRTARRWDDHWAKHDTTSLPKSKIKIAEELLEPVLESMRAGNTVRLLDAGCGNGVHVEVIERFLESEAVDPILFSGTAVDLSSQAVSATQRRVRSDRWTIIKGDAVRLAFDADAFDTVLSVGIICLCDEPQTAILELVRVTRPGGYIAIYSNTETSPITRSGLWLARLIGNTMGSDARKAIALISAPIIGLLSPGSSVSIKDDGFSSCHEIAEANLVSPITRFLDAADIRKWIETSGAVIDSENKERPFTAWCRALEESQA